MVSIHDTFPTRSVPLGASEKEAPAAPGPEEDDAHREVSAISGARGYWEARGVGGAGELLPVPEQQTALERMRPVALRTRECSGTSGRASA
jgi:hypothetical protein